MKYVMAAALAIGIAGCASKEIAIYRDEKPALDLPTYLNGNIEAWGIFQGRSGKVEKRFHVKMVAQWQGDTGTLAEDFIWSDGTKTQRVWTITKHADGKFSGRAHDVIGEAHGEVAGNAVRWHYVLALPVNGRTYHVKLDDWMFLMDDKTMINRSYMSKWGFYLGELTLTFIKQ